MRDAKQQDICRRAGRYYTVHVDGEACAAELPLGVAWHGASDLHDCHATAAMSSTPTGSTLLVFVDRFWCVKSPERLARPLQIAVKGK
jgi:hypothetical protein